MSCLINDHQCFIWFKLGLFTSLKIPSTRRDVFIRERLIENAAPKSTRAVTKWSSSPEYQNGRKNKSLAIDPCTFATDKSKV